MTAAIIAVHTITQADARAVLGYMGQAPGKNSREGAPTEDSMVEHLLSAAVLADDYNLERLARGYEGLVSAVRVHRELPNGVTFLRGIGWPTPF
jgi:hypothetical protein